MRTEWQRHGMYPLVAAAAAFSAPVPTYSDSWISSAIDFPRAGVPEGELVMAAVEITVNPNGYAETCHTYATMGRASIGPYTCRLIQMRSLFKPARDMRGRRTYGVHRNRVFWWSGKTPPPKNLPTNDFEVRLNGIPTGVKLPLVQRIEFVVDAAGRVQGCQAKGEWKVAALAPEACAQLPSRFAITPAKTRSGRSVASVQDATVRFVIAEPIRSGVSGR